MNFTSGDFSNKTLDRVYIIKLRTVSGKYRGKYRVSQKQLWIFLIIIRHIFSLARDWSKHVTWPNIPRPKLGNIWEYSPIFKTARVAKKIWRIINKIASIMGENMLGYLSLDIICSSKVSFPRAALSENCSLLGTNNVPGQISEHIFPPNGGYCLFRRVYPAEVCIFWMNLS